MHLAFPENNRFWVMGLTFFHNYYTIFDSDNKRVGITESKLSKFNNSIVEGSLFYMVNSDADDQNEITFSFIIISCLLVYLMFMCCVFLKNSVWR